MQLLHSIATAAASPVHRTPARSHSAQPSHPPPCAPLSPSAMPPRRLKFSLAAALFDFPAADGHSTPHQHAPDSWLELFTSKHADGEVFLGIFRSCRAGRDLVLCRASQAKFWFNCLSAESLASQQRRLAAVWAGLRTRGTQAGLAPANATVRLGYGSHCARAAGLLLGSLHQAEPNLGSLKVWWERLPELDFDRYTAYVTRIS